MNEFDVTADHVFDFSGLGFGAGEGIIITGAASGIGRASALVAARSGLVVNAWDLNAQLLDDLVVEVEATGGSIIANVVDVTSTDQIRAALSSSSPTSYLINNAGPGAQADVTFDEGVVAAIGSVHAVTSQWLDRTDAESRAIVNVASMAGNSSGGLSKDFYAAAKAGIAGYTRQLSVTLGGRPRVNVVGPGFIDTPRTAPYLAREEMREYISRSPIKRPGLPREVAAAIMFLASPAASNVNGVFLPVDGGTDHA